MFGEAAMFSAQLAGPNKIRVGMNSDYAGENYKLLLNIIHWLDRKTGINVLCIIGDRRCGGHRAQGTGHRAKGSGRRSEE